MRTILIDQQSIVSKLDCSKDKIFVWVKSSYKDFPKSISICKNKRNIEIYFLKELFNFVETEKTKKINVDKISIYFKKDGIINKVKLPIIGFYQNLNFLINWLGCHAGMTNYEKIKTNYKLIQLILTKHKNELFLPAQ